MQRCLAFAWLVGMASAVLQADDGLANPSVTLKVPRIFRPGRQQFYVPKDSPSQPTFDLKTEVSTDGNVVEIHESAHQNDLLGDEFDNVAEVRRSAGIIRVQHTEPFPDEQQLESIFPPPSQSAKALSSNAIPLDGALRENGQTDEEGDQHKESPHGSYSSLGVIAGANDRLGMIELDFKPSSRVWYDPNQPPQGYLDLEFGARWLNGPNVTDLPPQLFNLLINVGQRFEWNDRVTVDAMISPGWFTDFSNKGVEAFRLPWHLVSYYKIDDDWHGVLGVTDLARDDIQYLPVAGMVLAPAGGDVRLDLVFPRPRVAWKVLENDSGSQWLTLGAELGGGSYAISRSNRDYDVVTYRDYRLVAGLESNGNDGSLLRLEAGWVFDRSVTYRSGIGNYDPTDTFMIRVSSDY